MIVVQKLERLNANISNFCKHIFFNTCVLAAKIEIWIVGKRFASHIHITR